MNLVMDVLAACAICTEPFVHREDQESLPRESRKARIIRPAMWRNILPQAVYQIVVMIILIFGGQAMFFEKEFNIITTEDYDEVTKLPTDKMRKDVACFHTFMLMNLINMINCRVVSETQENVFKTLFNNKIFWMIWLIEMAAQNGMILAGSIEEGSFFEFVPKLFGTCDINWKIHLTAWMFGLFPLAIRPLTNKIPITSFHFMDKIDLETKNGTNCVTRWGDRAVQDIQRLNDAQQQQSGVW